MSRESGVGSINRMSYNFLLINKSSTPDSRLLTQASRFSLLPLYNSYSSSLQSILLV